MKTVTGSISAVSLLIAAVGATGTAAQSGDGGIVSVCHTDGQGRIRLIRVNEHAAPAHLQHGDARPTTFFRDADGDGFGDPAITVEACAPPSGFVANSDDCNDAVAGKACDVTTFAWEVSIDGVTWLPVALPDTNWGCTFCTRFYRTFVEGTPTSVTFKFASDNEARMFVNGSVVFDDYYINGVDWCTTEPCCAKCCDTPANCMSRLSGNFALDAGDLAVFGSGTNEIRWQVNQQSGGSGFYTEMTVAY